MVDARRKKEIRAPDEFSIERSINVAAPPSAVFDLINDLRSWERWNPNGRHDPTIERIYGGSPAGVGVGATLKWRGTRSGSGHMEIVSAQPPSELIVAVHFERPFKVINLNRFALNRNGSETTVIWSMRGPKPLRVRLLSLVINPDKIMAKHFEDGLAALKSAAETA